jgi:hypothetical protein
MRAKLLPPSPRPSVVLEGVGYRLKVAGGQPVWLIDVRSHLVFVVETNDVDCNYTRSACTQQLSRRGTCNSMWEAVAILT